MKPKNSQAFTIAEILVVLFLFAIVSIVATQTVMESLRGSRKSTASVDVKQNLDYVVGVMERSIRNAKSVQSECTGASVNPIVFEDLEGNNLSFRCTTGGNSNITVTSGEAQSTNNLVSGDIEILSCEFSCEGQGYPDPTVVNISIEARDINTAGAEGARATSETQVYIRNY